MSPALLEQIYLLAQQLPSAAIQSLVGAIAVARSGEWTKIKWEAQKALAHPTYRELVGQFVDVWQHQAPADAPAGVSAALEAAGYSLAAVRRSQSIELVWTGPQTGVAL